MHDNCCYEASCCEHIQNNGNESPVAFARMRSVDTAHIDNSGTADLARKHHLVLLKLNIHDSVGVEML